MSIQRYLIAGLKVEIDVMGELLRSRCEKYLNNFNGEPDMFINTSRENIDKIRKEAPSLSDEECEYIITGVLFYDKLLEFDGFLLHSSALSYNNKAYLFTADPGTGKSTHVSLWKEYLGDEVEIINDDKPAVRLIDGEFYAIGTPWSGKTDQNNDIKIPIGSVAILYRNNENVIESAKTNESIIALLNQTVIPPERNGIDMMSELLDKFIRQTKIYKFGCDISEQAVKTSFEGMTKEKYIKRI